MFPKVLSHNDEVSGGFRPIWNFHQTSRHASVFICSPNETLKGCSVNCDKSLNKVPLLLISQQENRTGDPLQRVEHDDTNTHARCVHSDRKDQRTHQRTHLLRRSLNGYSCHKPFAELLTMKLDSARKSQCMQD